jgi:signal transduction histidine kinase
VVVDMDVAGERPARLPDAVSLAAFRIVQESLTNARRHAPGAPVQVRLSYQPSELAIAIENRMGTANMANGTAPGVGILGMTERACAIGGTLRAGPLPDGFRVDAKLPYQREAS